MKILSVVGARPNFMKIAPFIKAIRKHNSHNDNKIQHILVHTGQHYDDRMSKQFFDELGIPDADINLGIGSGTHAEQVGHGMIELEKVFMEQKPDWVVVVGDVNATLAASVAAKKLHIKVCHIEAGLRSGDMTMPEEINRLVTDRLSDLLLTPDTISIDNLKAEGVADDKIVFVGNIMIDTLEENRTRAQQIEIDTIISNNFLEEESSGQSSGKAMEFTRLFYEGIKEFAVVTLHRPSNVDHPEILGSIVDFLADEVTNDMHIFWPIHPRTLKHLKTFGLFNKIASNPKVLLMQPLGYLDMLRLNMDARIMLTDSGGLQEECTILGTTCLTLRWNTERPVTLKEFGGASVLVGNNISRIRDEYNLALKEIRVPVMPELWDGKTAERCVKAIVEKN